MEGKTEDLYGQMRGAMDSSNTRADAEEKLNQLKAEIIDATEHGSDATQLQSDLNDALAQFKDVPELVKVLQPIADDLNSRIAAANDAAAHPSIPVAGNSHHSISSTSSAAVAPGIPEPVKLTQANSDDWSKAIGDTVDGLGKQDQLGLINIQEFNSQINQTKQIASALLDAADKAANAIIRHTS